MKKLFLTSLIVPTLLLSDNTNEEIAAVIKNDEVYSFDDLNLLKNDLVRFSSEQLENQNNKISAILHQNREMILHRVTLIANENLKELKSEISSLVSAKFDLFANTFSANYQAESPLLEAKAPEQNSSSITDDELSAKEKNPPSNNKSVPVLDSTASMQKNETLVCAQETPSQGQICKYRPSLEQHYFYGVLDFLFWTVHEGQQSYVIPNFQAPPAVSGSPFNGDTFQIGDLKEVIYNWAPGFRVALGYNVSPDYWDLEGQYTYVHPKGSSSVSNPKTLSSAQVAAGTGETILSGILPQFTNSSLAAATAHVSLNYQVADLLLAKRFPLSKQILCRLSMGGIGGFLSHHLNVNYYPLQPGLVDKNKLNWKFQGGGFKLGFETDWLMGAGFSLLGKFNGSLLYGAYTNRFLNQSFNESGQSVFFLPPGAIYTSQDVRLNTHRFASTAQFALGTAWGTRINNCISIQLFTGYEFNFWHNVHYFLHSNTESIISERLARYSNELLALQGFTGRLQLNY